MFCSILLENKTKNNIHISTVKINGNIIQKYRGLYHLQENKNNIKRKYYIDSYYVPNDFALRFPETVSVKISGDDSGSGINNNNNNKEEEQEEEEEEEVFISPSIVTSPPPPLTTT